MKHFFLLTIILFSISCNNLLKNYEDEWKMKIETRDFKGALAIINSEIKKDSLNSELYRMRGSSYFFMDEYESADYNYSIALTLDSTNVKTLLGKARVFAKKENIKQAISYIEKAEVINPNEAQIYLERGNIYAEVENYIDAKIEYRKAILLDNELSEAYNNIANILAFEGEFENAVKNYTKALKSSPKNADILLHRGVIMRQMDKIDEALADINLSISINSEDPMAYWNRASIYHKRDEFNKAILDYSLYQKLKPNDLMVYYNRGICYIQIEKYNEAIGDFNKAIDLDNTQFESFEGRGYAKMFLEDYNGACEDYKKAKELGSVIADEAIPQVCEDDISFLCEYKTEHLVSKEYLDYASSYYHDNLEGVILDYGKDYSNITIIITSVSDDFRENTGGNIGENMKIYIDNTQKIIDNKMVNLCKTKFKNFVIKGRKIKFSISEAIKGGSINHGVWHLTYAKAI